MEKIIWQFSLKNSTINIPPYKDEVREYEEIAIIEVMLENKDNVSRFSEITQRTIPYPLVLIFTCEGKTQSSHLVIFISSILIWWNKCIYLMLLIIQVIIFR